MRTEGTLIYRSIYEAAEELPDGQRLALYDAVMRNRFDGKDLEAADPVVSAMLKLLAPVFEKSDKRSEAGRRGAEVTNGKKEALREFGDTKCTPNAHQTDTKSTPSAEFGENLAAGIKDKGLRIKDKGISEESARAREDEPQEQTTVKRTVFRPPTAPDVWAYAEENGLDIDAEAFCDFYASKNWMVGRTKMTDWKAAARNWSRRDRERSAPQEAKKPASGTFGAFDQRKTPYETLFPSKYA